MARITVSAETLTGWPTYSAPVGLCERAFTRPYPRFQRCQPRKPEEQRERGVSTHSWSACRSYREHPPQRQSHERRIIPPPLTDL